jgi:hypothetical protein
MYKASFERAWPPVTAKAASVKKNEVTYETSGFVSKSIVSFVASIKRDTSSCNPAATACTSHIEQRPDDCYGQAG